MKTTHSDLGPDHTTRSSGIVRFAIDYPYFIVVICLMVVILGSLSLRLLPKDLLPAGNQPAVQILTFYSGMPVHHVAMNLSSRFERYTGQAIGIERQSSKSIAGVSIVRNFFDSSVDLNTAISQTTSLVMSVLRKLPPGTQPPLILPFDPMSAVPLALVAVSGDVSANDLNDFARYTVRNTIQSSPGAMAPTVMGGADREAIIYLDPKKIMKFNFSPLDVLEKATRLNTFIPTGDIKIGKLDYQILSNGLADKISDMNEYPLRADNGVTINLKDIGEAKDASMIQTNIVMVDGQRQVYVPIYRQAGANSLQIVDQVKASMKKLGESSEKFKLRVVADQSDFIRHAIESITEETAIGGGLAALMVLFFLGDPKATVGILLSIPISLLFAFIGLKALGQSLNAMTLGGLALSIGVLVDNSIVVLENIATKRGAGVPGLKASLEGASEVAMPVLASTLSTMVVLFPIVFLTGISKILFSALGLSVIFVMIGSYFSAMTVVPLFSSYFLTGRLPRSDELPLPLRLAQNAMAKLTQIYASVLLRIMRNGKWLLLLTLFILVFGVLLAPHLGTELFPRADAGNFIFKARFDTGTRIEETEAESKEINDRLRQWIPPEDLAMIITNAGVRYGFPAAFTPNSGTQDVFFNIELTGNRKHTTQYYADIVRTEMSKAYPRVEISFELGGLLTSALNGGLASPIDLQIIGRDSEVSYKLAQEMLPQIKQLNGAVDVRIQQRFDNPELYLSVNREKAGQYGLTVDGVIKSVGSAVSGSASFMPAIWVDPKSGIDYLFGVQMPESSIKSIEDLKAVPVTGPQQDRGIPLSKVADVKNNLGPSEINHENLVNVIDIYLDAKGRDVGGLSRDVQKILDQVKWPKGYSGEIRGEIREMNAAVGSLKGGFILAAILVYLILVIQFSSFKIPLIVMATVPVGLVGIVSMLILTHTFFSIQAAIGAIFMIGIAVANGVILIEFILHKVREAGQSRLSIDTAIIEAARARLRPILMTSLASMLGLVPMAIGFGHGSEANIPLGRAVIGGQLLSTLLTLFLVPVLFSMMSNWERRRAENFW